MYTPPPSSLSFDYSLVIEWLFVVLLLCLFIYAMKTIKNEHATLQEESQLLPFGLFLLNVPKWWSVKSREENKMSFHRSDTYYDWQALFEIKKTKQSAQVQLEAFIKAEKIEFDNSYDSYEKTENPAFVLKNQVLINELSSFIRIEGTCTQAHVHRYYYDILIIVLNNGTTLWCQSRSSVLNGCVEGPYFEETLKNLSFLASH